MISVVARPGGGHPFEAGNRETDRADGHSGTQCRPAV